MKLTLPLVATLLLPATAVAQSIQQAEMAADRCMYEEALKYLDKAPQGERDSKAGLLLRGRLLIQLDRGPAAVDALKRITPSSRREDEAARLLALGLALSAAERLAEAYKTLTAAREHGADRDVIDEALAVTLIQRGKLDEAEQALRDVLSRSPLLSGALYNLAVVRARRKQVAEAAALIRPVLVRGNDRPGPTPKGPGPRRGRSNPGPAGRSAQDHHASLSRLLSRGKGALIRNLFVRTTSLRTLRLVA